MNSQERLTQLCLEKLPKEEIYEKRFKEELFDIDAQNEYDYFLELYDKKVKFARNENNLLVPYLLGIVSEFDISIPPTYAYGDFPDIDIDFLKPVRDYLKNEWAPKTFGEDYVVNICSYNTYGIKNSLLDMARIFDKNHAEIQKITKKIGLKDEDGDLITWDTAMEMYPELKKYCDKNPEVAEAAKKIAGRKKSLGKHAGGLIISNTVVNNIVPLIKDKDGMPASSWTEGQHTQDLGPVGFVKNDLLVITNLLQIALACRLIKERHGLKSICALPGQSDWSDTSYLNDKKALSIANNGDLRCIFQFDAKWIRDYIKKGGINSFDDLVAFTSLLRPGPMSTKMHEKYIERKKGLEKYELHPVLKPILSKTYGVLCIHEDTLVSLENGQEIPIKKVKAGMKVHSVNEVSKKIEINECKGCEKTRIGKGIKLTLSNGLTITVTPDHKILTPDGMKPARMLSSKDLIAVPYKLETSSNEEEDVEFAYFLGKQLGSKKLLIDDKIPDRFNYLDIKEKDKLIEVAFEDLGSPLYPFSKRKIPDCVYSFNRNMLSAFFAGYFDSPKALIKVNAEHQFCCAKYINKKITDGLRRLCQIIGCLFRIDKNKYLWFYGMQWILDEVLPFIKRRKFPGKPLNENKISWFPTKYLLPEKFRVYKKNSFSAKESEFEYGKRFKLKNVNQLRKNLFITTDTALNLGVYLGDLRYYKITKKKIVNDCVFYGIAVENNHNLIANGIVVKNCYQESVMQLLNVVGGIPLKDCESLRKAISKKKVSIFEKYQKMFIENGQQTLGWTKEQVEELWKQIEAFAGYGFNKCISGDSEVLDAVTGKVNTIKEMYLNKNNKFFVHSLDENNNICINEVEDIVYNGINFVYELTTKTGKIIKTTDNHKYFTQLGWKELKDLSVGNYVACPKLTKEKQINSDIFWDEIVSIKQVGKEDTYDLTVKNNHNYFANDILVHNSHAVAYCYISSRLLWLKAHYPLEFFTAVLSCEEDSDKIKEYKIDAERFGVPVMPLDINNSKENFTIVDDKIYIGFSNLKGIGKKSAERILKFQPYSDFKEFVFKFGLEAKVIKPLIGLGLFGDDPIRLYKYYLYFKKEKKKIFYRHSRYKNSNDLKLYKLKKILSKDFIESYDKEISFENENLLKDIEESALSSLMPMSEIKIIFAKYKAAKKLFENKCESDVHKFEKTNFEDIKIDEKDLLVLTDKEKAEKEFYGFMWNSPLKQSVDYTGLTFEKLDDNDDSIGYVETRILKTEKVTSKKGTQYYLLTTEDANEQIGKIQVWMDDWERFEDRLNCKLGMVRLKVTKPSEGWDRYTLFAPPKYLRKQLPSKEYDYRVTVLRSTEEN